MPINVIQRRNPNSQYADAINQGVQGFIQGRQLKQQSQDNTLANAYKQAQIKELERKSEALGAPAPTGYLRDPYSGELKEDLTYKPNFSGIQNNSGLRVEEYDRYGRPKSFKPIDKLTAAQELAKDKATTDIFSTVEQNKIKREQLENAKTALPNAPQGLMGKAKVLWMKNFDPTNPVLEDWQKIKSIGTDAQLLNTARTKGAISDKEMALFATAAANDDLISSPRLKPILDKLGKFIEAEQSAKFGAYKKNYGEDPQGWFENMGGSNKKQGKVMTDANGNKAMVYPDGTFEEL